MKSGELTHRVIGLAVFVAVVGAFGGILWLFALAVQQGATMVAASLAAFATVAAALIVRSMERRKELEAARRERLGPLYEQLASVLVGHAIPQRRSEKVLLDFRQKALVYASPAVLTAFREWLTKLPEGDEFPPEVARENLLRYEALVIAMRKDLGVSGWTLKEGDLVRAFLTDFDSRES